MSRGPTVARLRRAYGPRVHPLSRDLPSLRSQVLALMTYLATGAGLAWGCAHLIRQSPQVGWWLYPATVFLISTRFRAVGNMLHEACHGILVRGGKGRNARFGRILAVLDFTQFESYSREHFTHHRHLGDPHRDLDFAPRRRFGFGEPTPRFAWVHYLRPLTLFHVPTFLRPVLWSRRDPLGVRLARLGYAAALLCLAAWAGWVPFALFYLVPYLTGYQVIRYWSDAVDHAGIFGSPDEFERSRNHLLPTWLLNRIAFPRNDEYHLTHHLFPAVPVRHQPRLHRLLMDDAAYRARGHRLLSIHRERR